MLEKLRNSSKSSIPKIVLGTLMVLLILSFAIWGTEDLIGVSKRQTTVAKVGNIDVSAKEFISLYTRQTDEIRKLLGSSLDIKRGREFGYVDRALSSLINRALFNNQAADLGLSVSDVNVRDRIIKDESFQDDLGQFSELIFRQLISESGYTEDGYVEGTRQDLARDQMVETLRSSFVLPKIISENIGSYNLEERSINYLIIKTDDQKYETPNESEISNFFKKNESDFQTDEYRDVETLLLDANKFAENTTVTDEEIEVLYEERKESLIKPERRYLRQILVKEQKKSERIYSLLKSENFLKIANDLANLDEEDVDLGWNTKTELPEEVVDEVFALNKNSISKPLESTFGWHIFQILDIEELKEFKLEDVKNKFRNELLIEKGKEAVYDLQDEIEDSLASGESLKEISEKLEVKLIQATMMNKEGVNIDGNKNESYQDTRILRAIFNQKENEEGNLIDIDDDNGLAVSIVKKIYPPKQMSLNQARPEIIKRLQQDDQFNKALLFANKLKVEILDSSISKVAKKYNLDLKGVAPFNRIRPDDSEIPLTLIDKIFDADLNEVLVHNRLKDEVIVSQVAEIVDAYGRDKEDMKSFVERIEDDMSVDLLAQFSEVLRKKYKISINDDVIDELN